MERLNNPTDRTFTFWRRSHLRFSDLETRQNDPKIARNLAPRLFTTRVVGHPINLAKIARCARYKGDEPKPPRISAVTPSRVSSVNCYCLFSVLCNYVSTEDWQVTPIGVPRVPRLTLCSTHPKLALVRTRSQNFTLRYHNNKKRSTLVLWFLSQNSTQMGQKLRYHL